MKNGPKNQKPINWFESLLLLAMFLVGVFVALMALTYGFIGALKEFGR